MRRALLLIAVLAFVCSNAHAARLTATFGDQNSSKASRVQATDDGVITFASDSSIVYPYENKVTAATTITLAITDSGSSITDFGGNAVGSSAYGAMTGQGNKYVLPLCTASTLGTWYTISTAVKETITVTPSSTADSLAYSISGTGVTAGVGIKNSGTAQAGDSVDLVCTSPGIWAVKGTLGTWAVAP